MIVRPLEAKEDLEKL